MWTSRRKSHGLQVVDNVDNVFACAYVDNVDNQKQIVHMIHMAILFCASLERARGFVDKVDNVDAHFKLVADETSTCPYTLHIPLKFFNCLS